MQNNDIQIIHGDCIEVMKTLPENSVDAVVTDPPYGWRFMGKAWDGADIEERVADRRTYHQNEDRRAVLLGGHNSIAAEAGKYNLSLTGNKAFQQWTEDWAREAFRVLKPGGHILVFCGPRTYHRMASGVEDAGFEIRDAANWIFGSGFPKSLNISKAIDKMNGADREVVSSRVTRKKVSPTLDPTSSMNKPGARAEYSLPSSNDAKTWNGWGTALKPACEYIAIGRKPIEKGLNIAQNVLKWGTGAMNIDGCRIGYASDTDKEIARINALGPVERFKTTKPIYEGGKQSGGFADTHNAQGRFPANVIHDGSDDVLEHFPEQKSGANPSRRGSPKFRTAYGEFQGQEECEAARGAEEGSAARFFYCAKADKTDRNEGLDDMPIKRPDERSSSGMGTFEEKGVQPQPNHHPTVKPTDLMRWLVRLVTPPNGTVLDPFLGSGSTAKACVIERFKCIGIEQDAEYIEIAKRRVRCGLQVSLI